MRKWFQDLLDWRLRRVLKKSNLPDLPEVRRMMRLSWWNGFTGGAFEREAELARVEAFAAMLKAHRDGTW